MDVFQGHGTASPVAATNGEGQDCDRVHANNPPQPKSILPGTDLESGPAGVAQIPYFP